jgi:hypothetical protein
MGDLYTAAALRTEEPDTTLRGDDPGEWGHSMANLFEVIEPVLDAAGARSVAELGAYAGDFTSILLDWAAGREARIVAVDPLPQPELTALAESRPELDLIPKTSAEALREMELPDAVIIDGDHNYHTVSEELESIFGRCDGADLPLILMHDVGWPHARRDAYYAPERMPDEYQERIEEGVGVVPGEPGVTLGGLPYKWAAREEGGERNGVLTAVEDHLRGRDDIRLAIVPAFFGLAVLWHEGAPWAEAVAAAIAPWDRNPVIARLEANRVRHLAWQHVARTYLHMEETEVARREGFLQVLRESRAFKLASRLAAVGSKEERTLAERLDDARARDERLDRKPKSL